MGKKYGKVIEVLEMIADVCDDLSFDEEDTNDIWDNGEDDGIDYSDLAGYEYEDDFEERQRARDEMEEPEEEEPLDDDTIARWDAIDRLQGKVKKGDCIFCGKRNGMRLNNIGTYACKYCHMDVHHEVYLQWYAGFDVYFKK